MKYWLFAMLPILGIAVLWYRQFTQAAPRYAARYEQSVTPAWLPAGADQEITRVEREVDQIEKQALTEWRSLPMTPLNRMAQVRVLGKLLLFDKNLSVD